MREELLLNQHGLNRIFNGIVRDSYMGQSLNLTHMFPSCYSFYITTLKHKKAALVNLGSLS